jgi:O-antigen ligase
MIQNSQRVLVQWVLAIGAIWTTIFITPNYSTEPIDLPKMYALGIVALFAFGNLFWSVGAFWSNKYRLVSSIAIAYVAQMLLVVAKSGAPFNQQFFGTNGRNTGFITYTSLVLVFLCSMLVSTSKFLKLAISSLLITGIISLIYGIMQIAGADPIKWNNPNNSMIGFLGNPDFSSAFLGILGAGIFSLIFSKKTFIKIQYKVVLIVIELLSLYLILKSHATQGLLIYLVGLIGALGLYLFSHERITRPLFLGYISFAGIILTVGVLGALKIGPLASHLYKISVRQRGFYWHAGREMLFSHPFFGVGLDSYGDWYYQKRSANAAFHSMQTASNAAHNVILDVASGGGFILLGLYLIILILVARSAIKILRNPILRNPYICGLILAWIAYEIQSIASINQIGLAIWGWFLGGTILGYELNSVQGSDAPKKDRRSKIRSKASNTFILSGLIGLVVGLIIVQPALSADHGYRNALQSRNGNQVIASVLSYPVDTHRLIDAANHLQQSGLTAQALDLVKRATTDNPRSYEGWYFISQLSAKNTPEYNVAIQHVRVLNPHDKNLK